MIVGLRVVVVVLGLSVVVDVVDVVKLNIPGSISSFGFIGNPVRVEFFTGATVAALGDPVVILSSIVLYPAIIIKIPIIEMLQN